MNNASGMLAPPFLFPASDGLRSRVERPACSSRPRLPEFCPAGDRECPTESGVLGVLSSGCLTSGGCGTSSDRKLASWREAEAEVVG